MNPEFDPLRDALTTTFTAKANELAGRAPSAAEIVQKSDAAPAAPRLGQSQTSAKWTPRTVGLAGLSVAAAALIAVLAFGAIDLNSGDTEAVSVRLDQPATSSPVADQTEDPSESTVADPSPSPNDEDLEADLVVFLEADASAEDEAAVRAALHWEPAAIESWIYLDNSQAFAEFEVLFADSPEILDAVSEGDLPPSFRLQLRSEADTEGLVKRLESLPGVLRVVKPPVSSEAASDVVPPVADNTALLTIAPGRIDWPPSIDVMPSEAIWQTCRTRDFTLVAPPSEQWSIVTGGCNQIGGTASPSGPNVFGCIAACQMAIDVVVAKELIDDAVARISTDPKWTLDASQETTIDGQPAVLFEGIVDDSLVGPTRRRVLMVDLGDRTLFAAVTEVSEFDEFDWDTKLRGFKEVVDSLRVATVNDFADGCPAIASAQFGAPTMIDYDGDGTTELFEIVGSFNRSTEAAIYQQGPDCIWERAAKAQSYASAGSPAGWGCRTNEAGRVEFVDFGATSFSPRFDGLESEFTGYVIWESVVAELVNSAWTMRAGETYWAENPFDAEQLGPCTDTNLPARTTERPQFVTVEPPVGAPVDRPCAATPGDQTLGPAIYLDLDADGGSEVLSPTAVTFGPGPGWQLTHTLFAADDGCGWTALGTFAQSAFGDQNLRWTCRMSDGNLELQQTVTEFVPVAGNPDSIYSNQDTMTNWDIVDGNLVEVGIEVVMMTDNTPGISCAQIG